MAAPLSVVGAAKTVATVAFVEASGVLAAAGNFLSSDSTRFYIGAAASLWVANRANRKVARRNDAPSSPRRRRPALRSRLRPTDIDSMTAAEMRAELHELKDEGDQPEEEKP